MLDRYEAIYHEASSHLQVYVPDKSLTALTAASATRWLTICGQPEQLLPIADAIYKACGLVEHRMDVRMTCVGCGLKFKSAESLDEHGICEACAEVKA